MAFSICLLEALPLELRLNILPQVSTVSDLLHLIRASPFMLAAYRQHRDRIFVAVVRNQIHESLLQHAFFTADLKFRRGTWEDFEACGAMQLDVTNAKVLLKQDCLTREIIEVCMTDELAADSDGRVTLSDVELYRLRRGLYNRRVASTLCSYRAAIDINFRDKHAFAHHLRPVEILEMLYLSHCLRHRIAKHLQCIDDQLLERMLYGGHALDFEAFLFMAGIDGFTRLRYNVNRLLAWEHDIVSLEKSCEAPAIHHLNIDFNDDDEDSTHDAAIMEDFPRFWNSVVPDNHVFEEREERSAFRWLNQRDAGGKPADYHNAIPLGFMIWDEHRLEQMSWMQDAPPSELNDTRWRRMCEVHEIVRTRFIKTVTATQPAVKNFNLHERYRKWLHEGAQIERFPQNDVVLAHSSMHHRLPEIGP